MMGLLASVLEALAGPLLRWVTIPALVMGGLVLGKALWDKRDARLLKEGEQICDARWRESVRESERAAADSRARAAEELLETERVNAENLRNELAVIQAEAERLRVASATASAATDSRCVSERVLDAARRPAPAGEPARAPRKRLRPAPRHAPIPPQVSGETGGSGIWKNLGF
jgi:hypothetical protein